MALLTARSFLGGGGGVGSEDTFIRNQLRGALLPAFLFTTRVFWLTELEISNLVLHIPLLFCPILRAWAAWSLPVLEVEAAGPYGNWGICVPAMAGQFG